MTGPVFLHVGEPKSGTTYLQDVMWRNRRELERQGIVLPGRALRNHFHAAQDLTRARRSSGDPGPGWDGAWDSLVRRTRRVQETAVISHELFVGAEENDARRAVRAVGVDRAHVIVTVRDFGSLLPAEWQETVKHRNGRPWKDWLKDIATQRSWESGSNRTRWFWQAHDTLAVLQRWSQDLPPERVHVVTMPPRGSARDLLWQRFASVIGADPSSADTSGAESNASLGVAEVEMLRRLNRRISADIPAWFYFREVKGALTHDVLSARTPSARLQLPPEWHGWASEQAQHTIEGIRAAGYDLVGDLDDLVPPAPSGKAGTDPDEVTTQQLLEAALASLSGMLHHRYENEPRRLLPRALQRGADYVMAVRRANRDARKE